MRAIMVGFAIVACAAVAGDAEATGECWIDAPCCHAEVNCEAGRRCRCEADCDTVSTGNDEGCSCWCEDGDDGGAGAGPRIGGGRDDDRSRPREKRKLIEATSTGIVVPRGGAWLDDVLLAIAERTGWDVTWGTSPELVVPCGSIQGGGEFMIRTVAHRLGLLVVVDRKGRRAFVTDGP